MTPRPPMDRRQFLARIGRSGVAVGLFGVAACSGDSAPASALLSAAPTSRPGTVPATTGAPGAAAPNTTGTTAADTSATTTTAGSEDLAWERVDLGFVSAYVLRRSGRAMVVDTGVSGSEEAIAAGLAALDLAWHDVEHIVLTHQHPDHVGSLDAVVNQSPNATLWAAEPDIGNITSRYRPLAPVADGDEILGLVVIETPGHTAGSISVLDTEAGVLVVGDALNGGDATGGEAGTVAGANPQFSNDMAAAADTVRKLAGLEFETVLFGHGTPVLSGASAQVVALAAGL